MTAEPTTPYLLAEMAGVQARLRTMLASDDPRFGERPPDGKWSIVENLCHLLFAEQLHLGRYLADPPPWSPLGLPPTGMQAQARFAGLARPTSSASEVLDEWARIHWATKTLATNDNPEVRDRMERHLKHLNAHVRVIERLLRALEKTRA
jgi:hypothetical protein